MVRHGWGYFWILAGLLALMATKFGYSQELVRVGVLDSGLDLLDPRFSQHLCPDSHHDFTGEGIQDRHGHGTHVAGLIVKHAGPSGYCLVILKYWSGMASDIVNLHREIEAIQYARALGLRVLNLSGGGLDFNQPEYDAIKDMPDTLFVVAAGNEAVNIGKPGNEFYPAQYDLPNIMTVGNLQLDKGRYRIAPMSNFGGRVWAWEPGVAVTSTLPDGRYGEFSGTSMSCAVRTGKIVHAIVAFRKGLCSPFADCMAKGLQPGDAGL